ncbi:hypothetical protein DPMN_176668 [Dreissena polymorpha]|uniref:Uncharacterized protein n=1 Tax=Dreissena polymorpha TaxID=45954 RepID=A0A9D4IJU4_DREPO|nr:hypothetical protein DPMN_176668 [Dreissena polymorpha]
MRDLALKVRVPRAYRMSPRVYMYVSSGYLRMPDEAVVPTNWQCQVNQNSVVSCRHLSATLVGL